MDRSRQRGSGPGTGPEAAVLRAVRGARPRPEVVCDVGAGAGPALAQDLDVSVLLLEDEAPSRLGARLAERGLGPDEALFVRCQRLTPAEPGRLAAHLRAWADLVGAPGLVVHERHGVGSPGSAAFLAAAVAAGLFPRPGVSVRWPAAGPACREAVHHLERRPYAVRPATGADLPALEALERACWAEGFRATGDEILARVAAFPEGQRVLVRDGRITAAVYAQRIADPSALAGHTSRTVAALHRPDGPVLQLLALNVTPEAQALGLGDQLLELALIQSAFWPGIERVTAVTLCRDFARRGGGAPLGAYVQRRDGAGRLVDPILRFHEAHGARLAGLVPGYRPEDRDNQGHGVRVEYDVHRRLEAGPVPEAAGPARPAEAGAGARDRLAAVIDEATRRAAGSGDAGGQSSGYHSFRDLGLDSLDLHGLRLALEAELGHEVPPTVFFEHPTPARLLAHLAGAGTGTGAGTFTEPPSADAPPSPASLTREAPVTSSPAAPTGQVLASHDLPSTAAASVPGSAIAVVGLGCRFPGGADGPAAFWDLLQAGRDAVTEVPPDRWDPARYGEAGRTGAQPGRHGGFLERVDQMDAAFFRIAPREAASMDPQQRLLLEVTWEALEHAGIDPASLAGTSTSVFTGVFTHDYETLQVKARPAGAVDAYFGTGTSTALAAGRLAYVLGLAGPALAVNTACSSSLVAVHLACQSLRRGESDLALAGGVSLLLTPELSVAFARAGMLSPSGRCRTFSAAADGYVRSDGCAVVVLERLADARRRGHPVLAVIRGTAINQDGASNGLTAPSVSAQARVIEAALGDAGLPPARVSYVEAHGTGTRLGDAIEVEALARAYGPGRAADRPLLLGSVKTNIGHAEAAAGVASLLKVVLALRHGAVPAHLHLSPPSPDLPLDSIPAEIPERTQPWPRPDGLPRVAGVSSFGFSGTNAHVVVEEALVDEVSAGSPDRPVHVLALSAASQAALGRLAAAHADHLAAHPEVPLADACFTAAVGRAHLAHRLAVPVGSREDAIAALRDAAGADGGTIGPTARGASVRRGRVADSRPPPVAFLFTGQGSQHPGMARGLYETHPGFRRTLDHCAGILDPELERPLRSVLWPGPGEATVLHETAFTQPALFAVEYALAQLWMSWGVQPAALLGHSVGEWVAACVAGVVGLEEALRVVAARGRLMQALPPGGVMAAVLAGEADVRAALDPHVAEVAVAALNGPAHVVVSGRRAAVERVAADLGARGVRAVPLRVSHAFHSPLMDPALPALRAVLAGVTLRAPILPLVSNLTGRLAGDEVADPDYWVRHAREPVRFADGVTTLVEQGIGAFVEVGPDATLAGLGARVRSEPGIAWLPSLRPGRPDWEDLAGALATLHVRGVPIDWAAFDEPYRRRRRSLPTYPFERSRHWFESGPGGAPVDGPAAAEPVPSAPAPPPASSPAPLAAGAGARVAHLYDGVTLGASPAGAGEALAAPRFLTYAPFPEPVAGFAWALALLAPDRYPAHARRARPAQEEMRQVLFREVDLGACQRALDIGCGEGADLVALALAHPGLVLDGYTLSGRQAERARAAVRSRGLDHRVHVYQRDSVADPFPSRYDLAFGFEVVHHVPDRAGLLRHVGRHLHDGGALVLADFVAHGETAIEDRASASVFATAAEWAADLAQGGLEAVALVDASPEIANFLQDEDAEESFRALQALGIDPAVVAAFRSYHRGGELLRRGLASYVLLTARKRAGADPAALARRTRETLAAPRSYGALFPARCCYQVEWRLAPRPIAALPPASPVTAASPSPREGDGPALRSRLEAVAARLAAEGQAERAAGLAALEGLAGAYAAQALARLGPEPNGARVAARHVRLVRRLAEIAGQARRRGQSEGVIPGGADLPRETARLAAAFPAAREELALVQRCGERLERVLTGEEDPLERLFPGGDPAGLLPLYRDAAPFRAANRLVAEALAEVRERRGREGPRALRVLEVGAGTGATTLAALPALGPFVTEYVFTDVSGLFLRKARESLGEHPALRFALFDAEAPPESQDLAPGRFDVVLAANALHATRDLRQALGHVRRLLAPDGVLVLAELVAPRGWLDLTFGLLPGWWRFEDAPLRTESPLLSLAAWSAALAESGFAAPVAVPLEGPGADALGAAVLVARSAPVEAGMSGAESLVAPAVREGRRWLVLTDRRGADQGGTGQALVARLRAEGDHCVAVTAGPGFGVRGLADLEAAPDRPGDLAEAIRRATPQGGRLDGVVSLWALDAGEASGSPGGDVAAAAEEATAAALHLAQALLSPGAPGGTPPRLYLVTRGAAAVPGPTRAGLAQSPLWGLAAALDREHPELGVVRIDLPPPGEGDPGEVEALLAEIRSPDGEDRVALRAGGRRVARLARLPEAGESSGAGSRWRVRPDRAYLLTGAFGGLGLLVADWLVGQGARHLHLVGRREPGPLAAEALARWRAAGVCVDTDRADVADRSELAAALERGGRALPQLAGVFHLAGMLDDGIVTRLDAARLRRVLRPKVAGAWLLHALLRDQELDAFVLFSSTASLLGHAGQANHAAANAFLDALAHHRRARGQAGLSIHWGPWAEVGAAARGAGEELVARGIEAIRPADGLAVLGDLLGGPAAEVGVAPVHWSRFMAGGRPGGPAPFYEAVRPAGPMPPDRGIAGSGPAQAWAQAAGPERRRLLVDLLRRLAASTLGAEPAQVDVDRPLGRLGLDSLMAVELRHALQRVLTVDVPVVRLMRDASVAGLAAEIEAGSVVGAAAPDPGGVTAGELVEGEL